MDQMMGNLFYRGVSPSELEGMTFARLVYWNSWHELIAEKEREEPR